MVFERLIRVARGEIPADLLVRDARVVNVLSGEIHRDDVAVAGGYVVGFGPREAPRIIEARGRYLCPGLIDGHIHVESTMLAPAAFCRAVAARGTAAVVCDPHEIANVYGRAGVVHMLRASQNLPVGLYVMAPSCVPATDMETSGARLDAEDVAYFLDTFPDRVLGLAEVMNYPGVLHRDPAIMARMRAARGKIIDGHAPLLTGPDLDAYILAGPSSDHECSRLEEAREKLRKGMHILVREGSSEHNLLDLLPMLTCDSAANISFACDDRDPLDLRDRGHIDAMIRMAVNAGVPPMRAVQAASINTARHYGLRDRGAVAPGFRADLVLLDDLESFSISEVLLGGKPLAELECAPFAPPPFTPHMDTAPLAPQTLRVPAQSGSLRAIGIRPGQIITEHLVLKPLVRDDQAVADTARDLAKLAVIERHQGTGNVGLGFVQGLGLKRGGLASTIAHDSHNLLAAGMDDVSMITAARAVAEAGGGLAVALDEHVLALLPLPVAGLMSDKDLDTVCAMLAKIEAACKTLGTPLDNPFATLQFLALPVVPALKLTDKGLVDVTTFAFTTLWT